MNHASPNPYPPRLLILAGFIGLYAALAAYATARALVASNFWDSWRGATLSSQIDGTAHRPYVYRLLLPGAVGWIVAATPEEMRQSVNEALAPLAESPVLARLAAGKPALREAAWKHELWYPRMIAATIAFLCLVGYGAALYRLAAWLFPGQWAMALFTPTVGLLIVPALTYPSAYLYDYGALFFSAAAFACLAARSWRWYYVWFVLACLNKESSIFLFIFYTLWFARRLDFAAFARHWLAQLAIWATVRAAIVVAFRDNPGMVLSTDHTHWQLAVLLSGYDYKMLAVYFLLAFLFTYRWQEKPLFARTGLILLALMFGAFVVYGHPWEYRVFYDIVPLLAVLVAHTLVETTGLARARLFACPSGGT